MTVDSSLPRRILKLASELPPEDVLQVSPGTYLRCPDELEREKLVSSHLVSSLPGTWVFQVRKEAPRTKLPDLSSGRRLDLGYESREVDSFPVAGSSVWCPGPAIWSSFAAGRAMPTAAVKRETFWVHLNRALLALPPSTPGIRILWKPMKGRYAIGLEALASLDDRFTGLPPWL